MGGVSLGSLALSADRAAVLAGVLILLLAAWTLGRRMGPEAGRRLGDWATAALLSGAIAARLGFVAQHHDVYAAEPLSALAFWQGGFSPLAGAAGFGLATAWHLARMRALILPVTLATLLALVAGLSVRHGTAGDSLALPADPGLTMLDGTPVSATDLHGGPPAEPLVINLWASWCPPCRREMPMMVQEAGAATGVRFVFANQGEDAAVIRRYLAREGIVMAPHLDPGQPLLRDFDVVGLPATLFLGADGRLLHARMGEISRAELRAGIDALKGSPE